MTDDCQSDQLQTFLQWQTYANLEPWTENYRNKHWSMVSCYDIFVKICILFVSSWCKMWLPSSDYWLLIGLHNKYFRLPYTFIGCLLITLCFIYVAHALSYSLNFADINGAMQYRKVLHISLLKLCRLMLLQISQDIAAGMRYLHLTKPQVIHLDIKSGGIACAHFGYTSGWAAKMSIVKGG